MFCSSQLFFNILILKIADNRSEHREEIMDITAIVASNMVAVGAIGFLLKLWVEKRLSHSLGEELEKFKTPLAKEISLYTIQNTLNHSKKVELLETLYGHMVDADFELKALFLNIKIKNKELIDERAFKFCEKCLELNSCLHRNELFLEEQLVSDVRETYKPFFEIAQEAMDKGFDFEGFSEGLPNNFDDISGVGDIPRKNIVKRFRESVGINA